MKAKFKETEIGRIPEEWDVKELKDISDDVSYGYTASAKEEMVGPKFLRITDIVPPVIDWDSVPYCEIENGATEKYKLMEGDIVIARTGANTGATAIVKGEREAIFASYLIRFRINGGKVNSSYVGYVLKSDLWKQYVDGIVGGSAQPGANAKQFGRFELPIPPLPEQSRIAKILSDLDAKIELNIRMNKTLEAIAQAIFKRWFVDFEFPNENGKPYRSSGGKLVDSELGEIPKGWEVKPIGEIAHFLRGFSYKGSEKFDSPSDYIFITLNNVKEAGGFKPVYAWISSIRLKERHFLKEYDVIIANTEQTKDGTLLAFPAVVYFPRNYGKDTAVFSHHITRVDVKEAGLKYFTYFYLSFTQRESIGYHTGSVIWALDVNSFVKNRLIQIAPKKLLEKFNEFAERLFFRIAENQRQIDSLSQVRDSLLPRLMSGKIRVKV